MAYLLLTACETLQEGVVELGASPALTEVSGDLAFRVDSIAGRASIDDLGLGEIEPIAMLSARYETPSIFLHLNAQSWARGGTGTIDTDLEFDGSTLSADTLVRSRLETTLLDQQIGYWLPVQGAVRTGIMLQVSQAMLQGSLTSIEGLTPPGVRLNFDFEFPLIAVGPVLEFEQDDWSASFQASGLKGAVNDSEFSTLQIQATLEKRLDANQALALRAEWRELRIDAPFEGERGIVEWRQPLLQITWSWRF